MGLRSQTLLTRLLWSTDRHGMAYMAWTDCRGEDQDIYFARSADFEAPDLQRMSSR